MNELYLNTLRGVLYHCKLCGAGLRAVSLLCTMYGLTSHVTFEFSLRSTQTLVSFSWRDPFFRER